MRRFHPQLARRVDLFVILNCQIELALSWLLGSVCGAARDAVLSGSSGGSFCLPYHARYSPRNWFATVPGRDSIRFSVSCLCSLSIHRAAFAGSKP